MASFLACLQLVNLFRAAHLATNVSYSYTLETSAQSWANYLADNDKFEHSSVSYGENIAKLYPQEQTKACIGATHLWYDEYKIYKPYTFSAGHFTQLVWKDTKYIGVGVANSSKYTYVVMQYDPPGNYAGGYAANVFMPSPAVKPPVVTPPPPVVRAETMLTNYTIIVKLERLKPCEFFYDIGFVYCSLDYTGGSGNYYTTVWSSNTTSINMFTLAENFTKNETLCLRDDNKKCLIQIKGKQ